MQKDIEKYFSEGCGRCKLFQTPECKVHTWEDELALLRSIIKKSALSEEIKWGQPCYTLWGKNVLILSTFKDCSFISFFKGALIKDSLKLLEKAGPNSESGRLFKFRSVSEIEEHKSQIEDFIAQAIQIEESGKQIKKSNNPLNIPSELLEAFDENSGLKEAFYSLTPGRQKGYIIYFTGAKQPETRKKRIEKYIDHILDGKGMMD